MMYNKSQLQAINHFEGPCLVLAGAGSGKTRVLTGRTKMLVRKYHVNPENILAVTFTNKAASEMSERIKNDLGGEDGKRISCTTFHSFGLSVLKKNIKKLGYSSNFRIINSTDKMLLIRKAMHNLNIGEDYFDPELVKWKVDSYKNNNLDSQSIRVIDPLSSVAKRVLPEYQLLLKKRQYLDFNDLLNLPYQIFKEFPEIRKRYSDQYKFIMVDEFQDTNPIQYKILEQLCATHTNLFVVGDDDQAIYGFRGADFSNILMFSERWKNCKTIILNINYRSNTTVVNAASTLISRNEQRQIKKVDSLDKKEVPIVYYEGKDVEAEALYIAKTIKSSIKNWSDYAILVRASHLCKPLELALEANRIPYSTKGSLDLYDTKEALDVLAYLRLLINENDESSMLRVINIPKRGIGDQIIFKISKYAEQNGITFIQSLMRYKYIKTIKSFQHLNIENFIQTIRLLKESFSNKNIATVLEFIRKDIGYDKYLYQQYSDKVLKKKLDNLDKLVSRFLNRIPLGSKKNTLSDYLEEISIDSKDSNSDEDKNSVQILTIHSAKGLEFNNVFLVGMNEGVFPHQRSIDEGKVEEERRLCYVALTRAKKKLYLTRPEYRRQAKELQKAEISRFIKEIPIKYFETSPEDFKENCEVEAKSNIEKLFSKILKKYD